MYKLDFTYKCLRDLHAYSGQTDALLHLNELANRELISQANQSLDIRNFILDLSRIKFLLIYLDLMAYW